MSSTISYAWNIISFVLVAFVAIFFDMIIIVWKLLQNKWRPVDEFGQPLIDRVILSALQHAYTANLGGISGANAKCQSEAQLYGQPGTWKALLATSTQTMQGIVPTGLHNRPVYNILGNQMASSWTSLFSDATGSYSNGLYSFAGRLVDEGNAINGPDWFDADAWTGTTTFGTTDTTCADWTSSTTIGCGTEVDAKALHNGECGRRSALFLGYCKSSFFFFGFVAKPFF
eukprot:m.167366 g.167366  ORF g.167366 m.167366 type:complete len:229 (-) comp16452_c6_seq1:21-707(-)